MVTTGNILLTCSFTSLSKGNIYRISSLWGLRLNDLTARNYTDLVLSFVIFQAHFILLIPVQPPTHYLSKVVPDG